jgi:3-hydroxybutyryl-CoA dehydrogenase
LVEIAGCVLSSPEALATVTEVARRCGKHPVQCGDRAGFIVNALLFPYLNDAVRILEAHSPSIAGVAPAEAGGQGAAASAAGATGAVMDVVDTVMTAVCRHPMGPFALLDVVGLDVSLAIQRALHREFREPGLAPSVLLEHLVSAGHLGRKTGQGFRRWPAR